MPNRIQTSNALSETTTFEYSPRGELIRRTRPMDAQHVWTWDYDAAGRLQQVTDPEGNQTRYAYDLNDNRTQITDALNRITQIDYDALNRIEQVRHPDQTIETFAHDGAGNRTLWQRPHGQSITTTYDGLSRPVDTTIAPPDPDGLHRIVHSHDGNGNLIQVVQHFDGLSRSHSAGYDDWNRRRHSVDGNGVRVEEDFDANHNRTHRRGPEGESVYGYNALNQMHSLRPPGSNAALAFEMSAEGRLHAIAAPNTTRMEPRTATN